MALPININNLLSGQVVEWDRLEFKEGWNPPEAMQAICAFANDFHNWGGGYLILGVEERDGKPVLPPKGLSQSRADEIQHKLYELGHKIQPNYHPICEPVIVQGKLILVVWSPGGEMRPYKAPLSLARENRDYAYFIRVNANTVRAKGEQEQELLTLANRIPFDDRQNTRASVIHLQPALIEQFLIDVGSELVERSRDMNLEEIGRRMQIVRGPDEAPRPLNVGLLFFSGEPAKWFPQTQIEVVHLPQGAGGDQLIEKTFNGPLANMLRDALAYLKNSVVTKYIWKHPDQAEASHYFNMPYAAIEEALVNAVYHRSYEEREPVEVRITPDEMTILSFPGPDRSVNLEDLRQGRAVSRRYRNRRIGEFLKELELSEGRSTGIPKILRAMKENGSGPPLFETDTDRTSFLVRLPVREEKAELGQSLGQARTKPGPSRDQVGTRLGLSREQVEILHKCLEPRSLKELIASAGRSNRTKFRDRFIRPLLDDGWLAMTYPDQPTSSLQAYVTTEKGKSLTEEES